VVEVGKGRMAVACGEGTALELLEVQRPGGRRQSAGALVQGGALPWWQAGEMLLRPPPGGSAG
jgi:methionyl-tRNA formyltransferase